MNYSNIANTLGKQMKQPKVTEDSPLRPGMKAAGPSKGPHFPSIGRWTPFVPDEGWPQPALTPSAGPVDAQGIEQFQ